MSDFHVLVLPPDPASDPEICSEPTQPTLPEWAEGKLGTERAHYEPLGEDFGVWWERNGTGPKNDRAHALWYAVHGDAATVPPGFLGPVIIEADDGVLPNTRLLSFLNSHAVRSFRCDGNAPGRDIVQRLVQAWRAAA